ncbi:MAG: hypothetical protein OXQ31_14315 [Spirochaetaceae bacterium]|nr:hypothetical protein [Spirochaetaceae bacterium]
MSEDYLSKADDEAMYAAVLGRLTAEAQRAVPAIVEALGPLQDEDVAPTLMAALEGHAIKVHGPDESRILPILRRLISEAQNRQRSV